MRRRPRRPGLRAVGGGSLVAAPTNTVAPVASGQVIVNGTLSVTTGTWTGSPSFTYQWKRAGVSIGGATANTYTPVAADIGPAITCTVTGSNAGGSANADSNALTYSVSDLGSKLKLWLDERDLVEVSGRYSDWGDQSAANNDFTQATAATRPFTGGTINSIVAPDFQNAQSMGSNNVSTMATVSAYHVMSVVNIDAVSTDSALQYANDPVICDVGQFWGLHLRNTAGVYTVYGYHWDGAAKSANATGFSVGSSLLLEWYFSGGTITARVGNSSAATQAAGNVSSLATASRIGGTSGLTFLDGRIGTVICCNAAMSADEQTSARAFMNYKYGVTV